MSPSNGLKYAMSAGQGAKQAFTNLLEQEEAWQDIYKIESNFLDCKRYKIVSTDQFTSKEDALTYINANLPFKMRVKTAGCVIMNTNQTIQYLFFKQENIKEKL